MKSETWLKIMNILSWAIRAFTILFSGFMLVLFIGQDFQLLSDVEVAMFVFIPLLYLIGGIVSLFRELIGGSMLFVSVVGFNIANNIGNSNGVIDFPFWFLLIPAFMIVVHWAFTKQSGKTQESMSD
ncbi:MAG: hypothetical protein WC351_00020 [Candidatus Izemoplasmatales bacterium]|jgi:hypothetical protein